MSQLWDVDVKEGAHNGWTVVSNPRGDRETSQKEGHAMLIANGNRPQAARRPAVSPTNDPNDAFHRLGHLRQERGVADA